MLNLDEYREPSQRNDQIIQRALRQIDSEPMATAMVGMPEAWRSTIFRNMSVRAAAFLKDDIAHLERTLKPQDPAVETARAFFAGLLDTQAAAFAAGKPAEPLAAPPPWDGADEEGIIRSFAALADFCPGNSLLALEGLAADTSDPLLRLGLTMLIDGADPLMLHNMMVRHKESYLRNLALRMDLIIDGIDNLASGDHATLMEIKLRSLVAKP